MKIRPLCYIPILLIIAAAPAQAEIDPFEAMGLMRIKKSLAAPDFTLQDIDGKRQRLSDFRGKYILLNFWATW